MVKRFAAIAGGGTASHAIIAVEVARALTARGIDPAAIQLIGSVTGREEGPLVGHGFPLLRLSGRGIVRAQSAASVRRNLSAAAGLLWATLRALATFVRRRPRVMVGAGGYASLPPGLAAALLRIPLVLLNADVEPGRANALLSRAAAACAVATPATPLPRAVVTGAPLRPQILGVHRNPESRAAARRALGIPEGRCVVCFVGGSLGARRVNLAAADLAERWRGRSDVALFQVTGRRHFDELVVASAPAPHTTHGDGSSSHASSGPWRRVVPFQDDMALVYEVADLMVCRSGAMTVAELAVVGVPSVLVPLAGAPGDHQTKNARILADAGAAVIVADAGCSGAALEPVLDGLLGDPARLEAMGRAALDVGRRLGHRDAAARIAELVCQVADDGQVMVAKTPAGAPTAGNPSGGTT